jgi:hypothetical protein
MALKIGRSFVDTTYLDADLRISRGSRSTVFVTARPRSAAPARPAPRPQESA